jgi:hypothetical protein
MSLWRRLVKLNPTKSDWPFWGETLQHFNIYELRSPDGRTICAELVGGRPWARRGDDASGFVKAAVETREEILETLGMAVYMAAGLAAKADAA